MDALKQTVGVVILVLLFCLSPGYAADKLDGTYCHDKKSWAEWDELIRKYSEDTSLQMLHALRIGFCKKIEDGTISFEEASMIFNKLHDQVIEDTHRENELRKENKSL